MTVILDDFANIEMAVPHTEKVYSTYNGDVTRIYPATSPFFNMNFNFPSKPKFYILSKNKG